MQPGFQIKGSGRVFNKIVSNKNSTQGSAREFVFVPFRDPDVCPVLWLDYYVRVCQALGVSLSGGYFFRASDRGKQVGGRPFLGSAVYNRLRVCLSEAKLGNSFRVRLSNTLSVLGCSPEEIALYLGWKSSHMARHYVRVSQVAGNLTLLESVMPRASTVTATVSHPANIGPIG